MSISVVGVAGLGVTYRYETSVGLTQTNETGSTVTFEGMALTHKGMVLTQEGVIKATQRESGFSICSEYTWANETGSKMASEDVDLALLRGVTSSNSVKAVI